MGDEKKKISFGFSKIARKRAVAPPVASKSDGNIQFIDCVEENSIKVIGGDTNAKPQELIIPMKNDNLLRDNLLATLKSRNNAISKNSEDLKTEVEKEECKVPLTLDEMAAKEIMEDLKKKEEESENKIQSVPLINEIVSGKQESTLEDYENVPVTDFGMAMLRGMGWAPEKGIGKNEKVVRATSPILRPKGMGLGADKTIKKNLVVVSTEELTLKKGSCIKVLQGQYKHLYGKIEGFEEVSGRLIVKLTISNSLVSLSEFMVEVVKLEEYNKNSKVINVSKYNEYKDSECDNGKDITSNEKSNSAKNSKQKVDSANSNVETGKRKETKNEKRDYRESSVLDSSKSQLTKKDNKKTAEKKSHNSRKGSYSSDSDDSSHEQYATKSSIDRHRRNSPDVKSRSRRNRSLSNSSNDSHKRSNKHKKHKLTRKHRSRSRSRSRHDKFKRKHRHKSPGRKARYE